MKINEDTETGNQQIPFDNRKPTRKQIRYYHYLCRKMGVPYEAANQHITLVYDTFAKLSARINELAKKLEMETLMGGHMGHEADSVIFGLLNASIAKLRQESEISGNSGTDGGSVEPGPRH